jgi:phosphoglucosamine mutase
MPELSLAGDGMITALCLLRALRESGKRSRNDRRFSALPAGPAERPGPREGPVSQSFSGANGWQEVEELLSQKGRLLLRYSGTEPLARVMIEGETRVRSRSTRKKSPTPSSRRSG